MRGNYKEDLAAWMVLQNGFGVPPHRYPSVRPGVGHDLRLEWLGLGAVRLLYITSVLQDYSAMRV